MKYAFIEEYRSLFRVEKMCRVLEVSRSGYYAWRIRPRSRRDAQNETLIRKMCEIHEVSRKLYGSPRMTRELKAQGFACGENRVAMLMRIHQIRARVKRKFRRTGPGTLTRITYAADHVRRQFTVASPDRVWVTDLTYIWTREGCLYLVAVLDLHSRRIVGWALGPNPSAQLTKQALIQAICRRRPEPGLVIHSDRGSQFASFEYQNFVTSPGFVPSMARFGNCYDNAVMESFFHTLKMEHIYWEHYQTRDQAKQSIFEYIELFYNCWRRHSTLGYMSPNDFEKAYAAA